MCATISNTEILHLTQELLLLLLLLLLCDSLNDCRWCQLKRINPLVLVLESSSALLDDLTAVLICRSSGIRRCVDWCIFTDVSEVLAAAMFRTVTSYLVTLKMEATNKS